MSIDSLSCLNGALVGGKAVQLAILQRYADEIVRLCIRRQLCEFTTSSVFSVRVQRAGGSRVNNECISAICEGIWCFLMYLERRYIVVVFSLLEAV